MHLKLVERLIDVRAEEVSPSVKVLVDIPIGLLESASEYGGLRCCDKEAKVLLGAKRSSVFAVPCRQAVYVNPPNKQKGWYGQWHQQVNQVNREHLGVGLSIQSLGLIPKIREVDELLQQVPELKDVFLEAHPELCFQQLKGSSLRHSKKTLDGQTERMALINTYLTEFGIEKTVENLLLAYSWPKSKILIDDLLDAICLAIHAKIGHEAGFHYLGGEADTADVPMKISYARIKH